VKIYHYHAGFLHQKVVLADSGTAAIGTANLDSRSLRLNFELMVLVADRDFAQEVAEMLENDFAGSHFVGNEIFEKRPFWFRLAARVARLFSPVL
jgi:cardiolipin synthase A/B